MNLDVKRIGWCVFNPDGKPGNLFCPDEGLGGKDKAIKANIPNEKDWPEYEAMGYTVKPVYVKKEETE